MRSEAARRAGSAPSQPAFNSQNDAPASASTRGKTKTSNSPHRSRLSENVQEPFYIFLTTSYFGVPEIVFSFSDLKTLLVCLAAPAQPARAYGPHIRRSGPPKRKIDLYRTGDQLPRHPRPNFMEFRVGMNCIEPPDQRTRRPSVNWFPLRTNDLQFKRKPMLARKQ